MFRLISRFIVFKVLKWKIVLRPDPFPKKYVLAVIPHTSNWDFPLGLMIRSVLQMDIKYVGKDSLFRPPFGALFRYLGGYPVDRSKSTNYVDAVVKIFNSKEEFAIAMAPEGTRRKVDRIKTGFYFIAKGANVPILLCRLDYGHKTLEISEPFFPSDNVEADLQFIDQYFKGALGKIPENSYQYKN